MYKKLDILLSKNKNSKRNLTKHLGYSEQKILTNRLKDNVEFDVQEIKKINKWLYKEKYTSNQNFLKANDYEKRISKKEKTISPIGKWLLLELNQTGKTQQELANELGVSAPTITNWITGLYKINQENLQLLAQTFNEDLKKLSSINNGNDSYISEDYNSLSYRLDECINNIYEDIENYHYKIGYSQMDSNDKDKIKRLIKGFLKDDVENYIRKKYPIKNKIDLLKEKEYVDYNKKLKVLNEKIERNNHPEYIKEIKLLNEEHIKKLQMISEINTQNDYRIIEKLLNKKKKG